MKETTIQKEEDDSKIQILQVKLEHANDEFLNKFQNNFTKDWYIYKTLLESTSRVGRKLADISTRFQYIKMCTVYALQSEKVPLEPNL